MKTLRNLAHDAYAVVGLLLLMQAPITNYLLTMSVPQRVLDGLFGFFGLVALGHSYWVASHTVTTTSLPSAGAAVITPAAAPLSTAPGPPPAPPT